MPPPELEPIAGAHRKDERRQSRWVLVLVVLLGAAAVAAGVFVTRGAGQVEEQVETRTSERDAAAEQASSLAERVVAACAAGGQPAEQLNRVGACQQAAQVRAEPIPGIPGPPGPGPSPEQIRAAVDAYLLEHPPPAGRPPTEDEVAAAVAQYLTANPPAPGRPPTAAEIADAVATYFATNPPPEGEPGRPPTAEEIRDAVDAYLAEHPPPEGPRGPAGPTCVDGTSLQTVQFADGRFGLGCVLDDQPTVQPDPTPTPTPDPEPDEGE